MISTSIFFKISFEKGKNITRPTSPKDAHSECIKIVPLRIGTPRDPSRDLVCMRLSLEQVEGPFEVLTNHDKRCSKTSGAPAKKSFLALLTSFRLCQAFSSSSQGPISIIKILVTIVVKIPYKKGVTTKVTHQSNQRQTSD